MRRSSIFTVSLFVIACGTAATSGQSPLPSTGEDATTAADAPIGADATPATEDTAALPDAGGEDTAPASTCDDNVRNGAETSPDCGGPDCQACADGQGCALDSDCASASCLAEVCQSASCTDGTKNGGETDKDCGGPACGPCSAFAGCAKDADCFSGVCKDAKCQMASCTDGIKNGLESAIDCAGACAPCADGLTCEENKDCASGLCASGLCGAGGCDDTLLNGTETAIDCGGLDCDPCEDGAECKSGSDCVSGVCPEGTCDPATCTDGVANGEETAKDCGGAVCDPCGDDLACLAHTDCESGMCASDVCKAPSCADGVVNGSETGEDCGGPGCDPCGEGGACLSGDDCEAGACIGFVCTPPTCKDDLPNGDETGKDCGGPDCDPCEIGGGCLTSEDCLSGVCSSEVCVGPGCGDGEVNGQETAKDCGGPVCDPCPDGSACLVPEDCAGGLCLEALCASPDADGDGVPDATDNCVDEPNAGQLDGDKDGLGDACDACPAPNAGGKPCPTTIYKIKDGPFVSGTLVALTHALVTGVTADGFFVQVRETDAGYLGPDFSGIWVAAAESLVEPGDRVDLASATIADVAGQRRLIDASVTVTSTAEPPPSPVDAFSEEVATGGERAEALDAVVVRVLDAQVTAVEPPELVVDGALRIGALLYTVTPAPIVGAVFESLTGVLDTREGESRLEPRDPFDVILGLPVLVSFGPATTSADLDQVDAPTFPEPLTVVLSAPVEEDTFVEVTSGDPDSLEATGGGVLVYAGESSAVVHVDAYTVSAGVTLTATLDGVSLQAEVAVVAPALDLDDFAPDAVVVKPGGLMTLTLTLNAPAPLGGALVTLAAEPAGAATLPEALLVAEGSTTATFEAFDAKASAGYALTATLGATLSVAVTVAGPPAGLIINEVEYDQVGTDGAEFIEIVNASSESQSLAGVVLYLVDGNDGDAYATIDLSGAESLAPGAYLVVAGDGVTVPDSAKKVAFAKSVQNGPDGLALVNTTTKAVLDALSYEGALTEVTLPGGLITTLVEGTVLPSSVADSNSVAGSLARTPNAADTDDAVSDWSFTASTPGLPNF